MTLAEALVAILLVGLTAYALTGGADFGAGIWDLFAGSTQRGLPKRRFLEKTIAPIWEANHVWLIFVLVILWTGFPRAFAAITSTLIVPLTLAAIGIILRGAGFAFRSAVPSLGEKRIFGATFALSSVMTPFFLGASAAAIATGRIPLGNAAGDVWRSWWHPVGIYAGLLGVGLCAYLAAVYLTRDAERAGENQLVEYFRIRALIAGVVVGVGALAGLAVVATSAPRLFAALYHQSLLFIVISSLGGVGSLALLVWRRFVLARLTASIAVGGILWGWAAAQFPDLLPGALTVDQAAADSASLRAITISLAVGAVLLLPSLWFLFRLFQAPSPSPAKTESPRPESR